MSGTEPAMLVFDRELIEESNYWKERLRGKIADSSIRPDFPRSSSPSSLSDHLDFSIDGPLLLKLLRLTGNGSFLIFTTLLAALKISLHNYYSSSSISVGTPSLASDNQDPSPPNAIVSLDLIDHSISFKQLLINIRASLLDAYSRQSYPFHHLLADLGMDSPSNRCPLFDMAISQSDLHSPMPPVNHDIALTITRQADRIDCRLSYDSNLHSHHTIRWFASHFLNILTQALEDSSRTVGQLQMVSPSERERLIVVFNDTKQEYDEEGRLQDLLSRQADIRPDAVAVTLGDEQLSYSELDRWTNKVASYLRGRGVGAEKAVGICVERSLEMVIAMVAVIKAGGCYVPLDPRYPAKRLSYMMEDAGVEIVITHDETAGVIEAGGGLREINLDREGEEIAAESELGVEGEAGGRRLAYIIYTSGTTGRPKGVMIEHRGVINLAQGQIAEFEIDDQSHVLQYASMSFDASVSEVWTALAAGARLCLGEWEEMMPGGGLRRLLKQEQITVATMPPGVIAGMTEEGVEELRTLVVAGESCRREVVERWSRGRKMINAYGPTEGTVCATMWEVEEGSERVWIGRAMRNAKVYVMDGKRGVAGIAVAGEISIGGAGVGRGYKGKADETAQRYVPNEYGEEGGERVYLTGDIGRYEEGGRLEIVGRADNQVKVRGYRIELGEVEERLREQEGVAEAVVVVKEREGGEKRLVGYIEAEEGKKVRVAEVRERLREVMPEYMVPSQVEEVERIERNESGKVDRKKMEGREGRREEVKGKEEVRRPEEEVLAGIWGEVLGIERVGREENFFDIGGHSLLATRVNSWVREVFQVEVSVGSLFDAPTIAKFAEIIENAIMAQEGVEPPSFHRVSRDKPQPLSFAQQRLWFLNQLEPDSAFYNIAFGLRLSGKLNLPALERAFIEIINRHEVLRTTFTMADRVPVQVIHPKADLTLEVVELSDLSKDEQKSEIARHTEEQANKPFNLEKGPLLRVRILKLGPEEHVALLTMHHIISDGWSMGIFIKEMGALYQVYTTGMESSLPELPIQYVDFAVWQREWLQGQALERQLAYWKEQLGEKPPVLKLPTQMPRQPVQSYRRKTQTIQLSLELSESLKKLSRREGSTVFMTLLSAFNVLLYGYTWQEQIIVGTPIANRNHAEIEGLIGFFVNTLAIHTDLSGDPSFRELLRRVRKVMLGAYAHQDLPFEKLVEEIQPERELSSTPLFQVMFVLQNAPMSSLELEGLSLSPIEADTGAAMFDLMMIMIDTDQGLNGSLLYDVDLFDPSIISRMLEHFRVILEQVTINPEIRLGDNLTHIDTQGESSETIPVLQETYKGEQFDF